MSRQKQQLEARVAIAKKAAIRWKERTKTRNENKASIRAGNAQAVESPARVQRFLKRATGINLMRAINPSRLSPDFLAERIIGKDDRRKLPENEVQTAAGVPVARIVEIHGDGIEPEGFGTGFMISPDLLMTNNHVLPSRRESEGCGANFGHDYVPGGGLRRGEVFELDTDSFFVTDEDLDFTITGVKRASLDGADLTGFGHHPLIAETGKILIGKDVNIIQHPMGGGKQYATRGNGLIDRLENFLHYETDTEPGASGSPVFNDFWEIVALHHSAVPLMNGDVIQSVNGGPWDGVSEDDVAWLANEGVRVSRILAHLQQVDLDKAGQTTLRDKVFATGIDTGAMPGDLTPSEQRTVIRTKEDAGTMVQASASQAPQTVVNIQGDAEVYTGNMAAAPRAAAPAASAPEHAESLAVLEKKLSFDPHYGRRQGFDARFLRGHDVGLPGVADARREELVQDRFDNPLVLDYHHFSLVINRIWLLQMWSAVNVDFSPKVRWDMDRADFGSDTWVHDPRISEALQIDNEELYKPARKFDRGHVVRRADNVWGVTREEVIYANSDTFHWTNCTPQHEDFNRSNRSGVWGKLENHIARQAGAVDNRLVLFAGPVLDQARAIPHDFGGGRFMVPLDFWKVVVVAEPKRSGSRTDLRAYGFLLEQKKAIDLKGLERLSLEERFEVGDFEAQQRPLATLQKRSGIQFPDNVLAADVMAEAAADSAVPLDGLENVKLRR